MRILVINTQSVNHNNATGITLRSILRHIPPANIMEIYMHPCVKAADALPILSVKASFSVIPMRIIANRLFRNRNDRSTSVQTTGSQSKIKHSTFMGRMMSTLIMSLDFEPVILTSKLKHQIKTFAPDCVYTLGNAIDAMKMAIKVSKKYHLPVIPHFMDNWQDSHRYGRNKYPIHLRATQRYLQKLYDCSKFALCISEQMAEIYEKRHGIPHFAMMNAVDTDLFHCETPFAHSDVLTYAGGLHLNRFQSLCAVAKVVDEINRQSATHYKLSIYTDDKSLAQYGEEFQPFSCVQLHQYVNHNEIKNVYEASRVLVHAESFDEKYREFIRYSISTKISEYLSTGRPMLIFAPDDIYLCSYINQNRVGIAVSTEDDLRQALKTLLFLDAECCQISQRAGILAKQKHDAEKCAALFDHVLEISVKGE